MIAMIVATAKNNVIGSRNELPWYLPADLKHFKEITNGHTVVMGRTTFLSIISRLGHPLANRRNIVLTRNESFVSSGVDVIHNVDDIQTIEEDVFIIGGAQVYEATLSITDKIFMTEVHADIPGDTYFPVIDRTVWQETSRESYLSDDKNPYDYDFVTYERI